MPTSRPPLTIDRLIALTALITATAAVAPHILPKTSAPTAVGLPQLQAQIARLETSLNKLQQTKTQTPASEWQKDANPPQSDPAEPDQHHTQLHAQIAQLSEKLQQLEQDLANTKKPQPRLFTNTAEATAAVLDSKALIEHRIAALRALRAEGQISADVVTTMLELAPQLEDHKSREEIFKQFEGFEEPLVVEPLLAALQHDQHPKIRRKVGEILTTVQNLPTVRAALTQAAANDPDPEVREHVEGFLLGTKKRPGRP